MAVANFKGVSDISIIHNNTLMTEGSEGLFNVGCSLINFMCAKMRIQNKTLITLLIGNTGVSTHKIDLMHIVCQ